MRPGRAAAPPCCQRSSGRSFVVCSGVPTSQANAPSQAHASDASTGSDPAVAYRRRLGEAEAQAAALDVRAGRIGLFRFVAFAVAVGMLIAAFDHIPKQAPPALLWLGFVVAAVGFVWLVFRHAAVIDARDRALHLAAVNRQGLARVDGSWPQQAARPLAQSVRKPPYSEDLDLSGVASLQQLCDVTHTELGEAALFRALARAAAPEVDAGPVRARQAAVRDLVPRLDLRQAFEVAGRRLGSPDGYKPNPEPFLRWAEGPARVSSLLPWPAVLSRLPWLSVALLLLCVLVPSTAQLLGVPVIVLLCVQGLVLLRTAPAISRLMTTVAAGEVSLSAYGDMLELLASADFTATDNQTLQANVRSEGQGPAALMRRLQGDYSYLELRRNPLVWFPLNIICLWDLFFALRIERWQAQVGPRLRGWLQAVGELEARSSLATLAFDHPDWVWPDFVDGGATFSAEALGHPLLPAAARVANDVTLPGAGQAWLITGSNMSGKSTLLRAIGLGHVMAQAGGPVCARRVTLSPLSLRTVMRVDDSLARGVSHFYAELQRLKDAVDASRGSPPLCYLLDEILHGTNTRERELGARLVVRTLCGRGSTGAVSTHDLSLASLADETQGAVHNVHFTEIIEGDRMRFDFRLRQGPVQTTNALRLMRQVGIDLNWDLVQDGSPAVGVPPSNNR